MSLKVASFGGDAQGTAITNAIARFNKNYPNVTVELSMDPISTGWGDCVTKGLSQFTSGDTADNYGTAIETFRPSPRAGCGCAWKTISAPTPAFRISRQVCSIRALTRGTAIAARSEGTTS